MKMSVFKKFDFVSFQTLNLKNISYICNIYLRLCLFLFKEWSGLIYVHAEHLNKINEVTYLSFKNRIFRTPGLVIYYFITCTFKKA